MPTDKLDLSIGKMYIENPETGERTELNGIEDITIATLDTSKFEPITIPKEYTLSVDLANMPDETMQMLFGKKLVCTGSPEEIRKKLFWELPINANILNLDLIQNKTHKKHRINKKWAKRYGYTCTVFYG